MSVNVASGRVWIPGTSVTNQGSYMGFVESTTNLAIGAASASNNRTDTIVAQIKDETVAGSGNEFLLSVVPGTAEGGVTKENHKGAGSVPASAIVVAYIFVEANATSIKAEAITNIVGRAALGLLPASLETWTPTLAQEGTVTATVNNAEWTKAGHNVAGEFTLTASGAGHSGKPITAALPTSQIYSALTAIGSFTYYKAGGKRYAGTVIANEAGVIKFQINETENVLGVEPAFAIASGDILAAQFSYFA